MWQFFSRLGSNFAFQRNRLLSGLFVVACFSLSRWASAEIMTNPAMDTKDFGDDKHTSVVKDLTAISGANGNDKTQSGGLINAGNAAFKATHAGWNFNWASADDQKTVEATFAGSYYAWVVSTTVTSGDGTKYTYFKTERGGAVFNVTANYAVPKSTDTDTYSLHWIQAYSGEQYGKETAATLDNPFNRTVPFYDKLPGFRGGAAGTLNGNPNAWFTDVPFNPEKEYEMNPVADLTFQVVLALDDKHTVDGKVVHDVTLLGGYQWGFVYTAEDNVPPAMPEPATLLMCLQCLGIGVCVHLPRRLRHRRSSTGVR